MAAKRITPMPRALLRGHAADCDRTGMDCTCGYHDLLAAAAEVPETPCPRCGAWVEDWDGFGVLRDEACGYCAHPSRDKTPEGWKCGLCGDVRSESAAPLPTPKPEIERP